MNSSASSRARCSSSSTCRICERTATSSIETGRAVRANHSREAGAGEVLRIDLD
jgi:hypothetical protein